MCLPFIFEIKKCIKTEDKNKKTMSSERDFPECFLCRKPGVGICESCGEAGYCCQAHLAVHRSPKDPGRCLRFRIERREGKGNVMVATRDIEPGEVRKLIELLIYGLNMFQV